MSAVWITLWVFHPLSILLHVEVNRSASLAVEALIRWFIHQAWQKPLLGFSGATDSPKMLQWSHLNSSCSREGEKEGEAAENWCGTNLSRRFIWCRTEEDPAWREQQSRLCHSHILLQHLYCNQQIWPLGCRRHNSTGQKQMGFPKPHKTLKPEQFKDKEPTPNKLFMWIWSKIDLW